VILEQDLWAKKYESLMTVLRSDVAHTLMVDPTILNRALSPLERIDLLQADLTQYTRGHVQALVVTDPEQLPLF
jgi:hypothetical protein